MTKRVDIRPVRPTDSGGVADLLLAAGRPADAGSRSTAGKAAALASRARRSVAVGGWVAEVDCELRAALLAAPDGDLVAVGPDGACGDPALLADLYARASREWVAAGAHRHTVLVAASDIALRHVFFSLGFGLQQVYARRGLEPPAPPEVRRDPDPIGARRDPEPSEAPTRVGVRVVRAGPEDLTALTALVPLVSVHMAEAPCFAPRSGEFFDQLPASVARSLAEGADRWWLARAEDRPVGFALAGPREPDPLDPAGSQVEFVLAGVDPAARRRGVARALFAAVLDAARADGATVLTADWRSANLEADRTWSALGFQPVAHRLARTVDLTPR